MSSVHGRQGFGSTFPRGPHGRIKLHNAVQDMPVKPSNMPCVEELVPVRQRKYVLVTAAYNEEAFIEGTIRSIVNQSVQPLRWVIVSDGSSDRTDEIIKRHAAKHDFIRFLRVTRAPGRSFGSKVRALQAGVQLLEGTNADFIGNLDADVSLGSSYFEDLIAHFERRPMLG